MSKQYGISMLPIGLVFAVMLLDPSRSLTFIWIAVGYYIYSASGQLTTTQFIIQAAVNAALIIGMFKLWLSLKKLRSPARREID